MQHECEVNHPVNMLLPMHPQPFNGEILSSWMVRLAFDNGFGLHTFYKKVVGYDGPIWNRDIDRRPAQALIGLLSAKTGLPSASILALSLRHYEGRLFEAISAVGGTAWLLPVGVFHRIRLHAGMQYCSACLNSDEFPYYRRYWRLAHYTICHLHGCLMRECCDKCKQPVAFHRHGVGRRKLVGPNSLRYCNCCGNDLALAEQDRPDWLSNAHLSRFIGASADLEDGTRWQYRLRLPCSIPFFDGLRCLIRVLMGRNGVRLRKEIYLQLGLELYGGNRTEFEKMSVRQRAPLVFTVLWLIETWPKRFIEVFEQSGFTRSRIAEAPSALPYWLATSVDSHLNRGPVMPCDDEIVSAGLYLQRRGNIVTAGQLASLMGMSRDYSRYAYRIWLEFLTSKTSA